MSQLEEFKALGLSDDILAAIAEKGFETPSAIQSLTIPHLLQTNTDMIAQAQTGTGKTAAFGLPIIQKLTARNSAPQAIILVPTRELALQVTQEMQSFNSRGLSIAPIYGGAAITEQLRRLKRGIDIVVGTPGRILDHIRRRTLDLSSIAYLVLDEADEMLNMGFIDDIEDIMHGMTGPKRVLLFSATMPDRISSLARKYMTDPEILKVETKHITTDLTNQIYFEVREGDKFDALTRIIDVESDFYGIIFSRTKVGVDDIVAKLIARGYSAEGLHGDISQAQREKILGKFKKKNINILVATDVAARGIDVNNLTHVINYSLPQDTDSYVHRIGRTGRAGNQGTAITFISPSEMRQFGFLKRTIKADIKLEQLPTPADVIATKRNRIKEDLYAIIESENYTECGDMAAELLVSYTPEIALSALLRLAFKDELSESNYPEIRSINVDRKGKARIFIALGVKNGYDSRHLVKLLKRECTLTDHEIDDIRIMDDFSFVTVPFDQAEKVVRTLNMISEGGPVAEISKDKEPAGGDRRRGRSGGGGGYGADRNRDGARSGEYRRNEGGYGGGRRSEGGSDRRYASKEGRFGSEGGEKRYAAPKARRSDSDAGASEPRSTAPDEWFSGPMSEGKGAKPAARGVRKSAAPKAASKGGSRRDRRETTGRRK